MPVSSQTSFISSFLIYIPLILFSCFLTLGKTFSMKLKGSVERDVLAFHLILVENFFIIKYDISCRVSVDILHQIKNIYLYFWLTKSFFF